jgi:hypothetical protein
MMAGYLILNQTIKTSGMKTQKILFYAFKWLALIFLAYLTINESHSKIMMLLLIAFVCVILIWEGVRDFKTKGNQTNTLT